MQGKSLLLNNFSSSSSLNSGLGRSSRSSLGIGRAFKVLAAQQKWREESEEESISDAEALLACWSYLNKRKQMGNWTNFERRKERRKANEPQFFLELEDLEVENPDQLYENVDDFDELELKDGDMHQKDNSGSASSAGGRADEIWYGEFLSFPAKPSETRLRRSLASKRTWSDPEFRKKWHNKRWGEKGLGIKEVLSNEKKIMRNRVRALPAGFLCSSELASMTEMEIDQAIKTYRLGRKRQSKSRASTMMERKKKLSERPTGGEERLARDSLFAIDNRKLIDAKKKRSETAKKAYKTRLKNSPQKVAEPPKANARLLPSNGARPQDAMIRIEADLSLGAFPRIDDLKLIMGPQKMRKRRETLRRILSERFSLRGRCIPSDLDHPIDSAKEFVTQAPIQKVGNFVIYLLEDSKNSKSPQGG